MIGQGFTSVIRLKPLKEFQNPFKTKHSIMPVHMKPTYPEGLPGFC